MIPKNSKSQITIVGAGFSGLTAAYYLNKSGFDVRVVELSTEVGGLIHTVRHPLGLVETAANAVINSHRFESLCQDIGLPILGARKDSKKRYIFRNKPRQWPLDGFESFGLFTRFLFTNSRAPKPEESISQWGYRVLGAPATEFILGPALSGIYAGNPSELSASLILGRYFAAKTNRKPKPPKPLIKGTVAPWGGMGELLTKLADALVERGVKIEYGVEAKLKDLPRPVVFCGNMPAAGHFVEAEFSSEGDKLKSAPMLGAVSVHTFFEKTGKELKGFGCLFPPDQGFRALGVLFNADIFEGRSTKQSERWIFGGAIDPTIQTKSDSEIIAEIVSMRTRLHGFQTKSPEPVAFHIKRWPVAFPHYTVELEKLLNSGLVESLDKSGVFLLGNYTGALGLSRILDLSAELPARLESFSGK